MELMLCQASWLVMNGCWSFNEIILIGIFLNAANVVCLKSSLVAIADEFTYRYEMYLLAKTARRYLVGPFAS